MCLIIFLYWFGAGVSFGRSDQSLSALPNVVFLRGFPAFTELGSSYEPGPGPSFFLGLRWSLLRTSESKREPSEKQGAVVLSLIVYVVGPRSPSRSFAFIWNFSPITL